MNKLISSIATAALLSTTSALATVQPVNIVLHDGNLSYSIPTGKVLQIEHLIWALESDSTHQVISIKPVNDPTGVGDFQLKFTTDAPDSYTPTRPIRVVGGSGAQVSIINNGLADWRDVMIVGLLIDPEDLYADISTELLDPRMEDGRLVADLQYASPRPRVVSIESSPDLLAYTEDPTAVLSETTSPSLSIASISASHDQRFMRAKAIARMQ